MPLPSPSVCLLVATLLAAQGLAACGKPSPAAPRQVPRSDFLLGGIQVNEPDLGHWIDALAAEGMNTVEVTSYAKQGDWDSDNLFWDDDHDGILPEVRAAKQRGMKAVLILRVALDSAFPRNQFLWHGMIMPKNDQLLDSWFERYTRFVVDWAAVAQREGVDALMIGSEMNTLTSTVPLDAVPDLEQYYLDEKKQEERKAQLLAHQGEIEQRNLWLRGREQYGDLSSYLDAQIATEKTWASQVAMPGDAAAVERLNARRARLQEKWLELIRQVRAVYSGPIGYAANFDQYQQVGFWKALDLMGINAYFPLRKELLPRRDEPQLYALLVAGWEGILGEIAAFRTAQALHGRSLVFTELGYTWRTNSTIEPWADTGFSMVPDGDGEKLVIWQEQERDPEERALAVRALYEAHRRLAEPMLEGILYWKLSTVAGHDAIEAFVLHIGGPTEDPLAAELRRFVEP